MNRKDSDNIYEQVLYEAIDYIMDGLLVCPGDDCGWDCDERCEEIQNESFDYKYEYLMDCWKKYFIECIGYDEDDVNDN